MRIGENEMLILRKLKKQLEEYRNGPTISPSLIGSDLIEDIYFPNWDYDDFEAFSDFHQIPEYLSAKASFSRSISGMLDAGIITKCSETTTNGCNKDLCYTITDKGVEYVENMSLMNCTDCKNFYFGPGCCITCEDFMDEIPGAGYCKLDKDGHIHKPKESSCVQFEHEMRPTPRWGKDIPDPTED